MIEQDIRQERINRNARVRNSKRVLTYDKAGNHVELFAPNKRPKPSVCELCEVSNDNLGYHHWDERHPSHGIWLCYYCHMFVERWEQGGDKIIARYLILREVVDDELSGLE